MCGCSNRFSFFVIQKIRKIEEITEKKDAVETATTASGNLFGFTHGAALDVYNQSRFPEKSPPSQTFS